MSRETLELIQIFDWIINAVLFIVFIVMAMNISKIRKQIAIGTDYRDIEKAAEKELFFNNKERAIRLYHEAALALINMSGSDISKRVRKEELTKIANAITKSGGMISSGFADELEKLN